MTHPQSMRLPSNLRLTADVLAGIAARLTRPELGDLVEMLIERLDGYERDADCEPDPEMCRA